MSIKPPLEEYSSESLQEYFCIDEFSIEFNRWLSYFNKFTGPLNIKNKHILKVLEHIQLHYQDAIVLTEVSEEIGMTAASLSKLVKRFFGFTFTEVIIEVRVAHAMELIRTTDQPLGNIASDCGFTNGRTFTRSFRHITGMTPSEFRKACSLEVD